MDAIQLALDYMASYEVYFEERKKNTDKLNVDPETLPHATSANKPTNALFVAYRPQPRLHAGDKPAGCRNRLRCAAHRYPGLWCACSERSGPCSCAGDLYNCSDFATHSAAQACFDFCESQGVGDVHHLDSDGDGNACESLPGNFVVIR